MILVVKIDGFVVGIVFPRQYGVIMFTFTNAMLSHIHQ